MGCGLLRHSVDIQLHTFYVEDFPQSRLLTSNITPSQVSGLLVGPRTVLEIFSDGVFYEREALITNKSYCYNKFHDLGCTLDQNWQGYLGSFRLWNYDYYVKTHRIRYCNSDRCCKSDEYCLCPNGYQQPEWCPISKRRCMPKSKYLQSNYPTVDRYDLIDVDCMSRKTNRSFMGFNDIVTAAAQCDIERKEFFDGGEEKSQKTYSRLFVLIIVILVALYIYKKY
jgi:hypothetical protein